METKFLLELYYLERFVMKLTNHYLFDFVFFLKIWNSYLLIAFETYRVDWQLKFLQMIWSSLSNWKVLLTKTNLYKHIINSWFIVYEFCDFSSLSSLLFFPLFLKVDFFFLEILTVVLLCDQQFLLLTLVVLTFYTIEIS